MKKIKWLITVIIFYSIVSADLPLYYWDPKTFTNFGDYLSLVLVERVVGKKVAVASQYARRKKLLAIGSIMSKARTGDVVWGAGVRIPNKQIYKFKKLDIRAVRGPLTRDFLLNHLGIECPEVYGDPALLVPYFFPEFKKAAIPEYEYLVIPHFTEEKIFSKEAYAHVVYSSDPWYQVISKIVNSRFVISGSLHGIIIAEAYGIPARVLRAGDEEPLFKYHDYYAGTGRTNWMFATSVEEALALGGEQPGICDIKLLLQAFPFDYWPMQATKVARRR